MLRRIALIAALLVAMPAAAQSYSAVTKANLNVRAGPGTASPIVHTLQRGEAVTLIECAGSWCRIEAAAGDGWVSRLFLEDAPGTGSRSLARPGSEAAGLLPSPARACFYEGQDFTGRSFCAQPGDTERSLGTWDNRIASIRLAGGASVRLCTSRGLRSCSMLHATTPRLAPALDRNISSLRVLR